MLWTRPHSVLNFDEQEDIEDAEDEDEEIILGRGNRSRKETNYDDQLSERDWLKAIGVRFTPEVSFVFVPLFSEGDCW